MRSLLHRTNTKHRILLLLQTVIITEQSTMTENHFQKVMVAIRASVRKVL